jgi:hypothetical protein
MTSASNDNFVQGWVWKGLTRTDPTLQVYKGLPRHSATWNFHVDSAAPPTSTQPVGFSLASSDGEVHDELDNVDTMFLDIFAWRGASVTMGNAHALLWSRASVFNSSRPTAYIGYDTHPITSAEAVAGSVSFNLQNQTILTTNISGTVATSSTTDRDNSVFVRFSSGATITLVDETNGATTFSYLVPTLPNATITVAAARSSTAFPPYTVAHQDGIVPAQTGIALSIPDPAVLRVPIASTTGVDANTVFQWTGPSAVNVFRVDFDQGVSSNSMWVVTQQPQTQLPSFPGTGLAIPAGATAFWTVETHGNYATVNDATGPTGMLDSMSASGEPFGPRTTSGTFTQSEVRPFTVAP